MSRLDSQVSCSVAMSMWGKLQNSHPQRFQKRFWCCFAWEASHVSENASTFVLRELHRVLLRVFCESQCQGCVKWWQPANSVAGVGHGKSVVLRSRRSICCRCSISDTLHSTLYTLHSTHLALHSTLYTLHSTLCTLLTPHSTLYTPHSRLHTLHFTVHTLHFTLHA